MPAGDEPMLPQPSDDNTPMISGRGTKIIADARGAYLAGNLRALTETMTPEQADRYRAVVLDQAAAMIRALLGALGIADPTVHPAVQALHMLMMTLDPAYTVRVLNCFFEPEREPDMQDAALTSRVSEDALYMLSGAVTPFVTMVRSRAPLTLEQSMWLLPAMAGQHLRDRGYLADHWWASERITPQQIHSNVQRWLVELAWRILLGKPEPSLDDLSQFGAMSMLG